MPISVQSLEWLEPDRRGTLSSRKASEPDKYYRLGGFALKKIKSRILLKIMGRNSADSNSLTKSTCSVEK